MLGIHLHKWKPTSVFIIGEIRKRDCPGDRYGTEAPDVRVPGIMVYCGRGDCRVLGIRPEQEGYQTVEIEV